VLPGIFIVGTNLHVIMWTVEYNKSMKTIKRPLAEKVVVFRAYPREFDLLRAAAEQKEVSMSELIRQAVKEKAGRVLAGIDNAPAESAS
jgi:hypothetical protein